MLKSSLLLYFYLFVGGQTKAPVAVLGVEVRGPRDGCSSGSQWWRSGVRSALAEGAALFAKILTTNASAKPSFFLMFKSPCWVYQVLFLRCYFLPSFFKRLRRVSNEVLINTALFSLPISLNNNNLCEEDKYSLQTQQSGSTKPIISCLPLQQASKPVPPHPLQVPQ